MRVHLTDVRRHCLKGGPKGPKSTWAASFVLGQDLADPERLLLIQFLTCGVCSIGDLIGIAFIGGVNDPISSGSSHSPGVHDIMSHIRTPLVGGLIK